MLFSLFDVLGIFEALEIFFYKFLFKWGKYEEDFKPSIFFEGEKYYFVLESRLDFFFKWSYSQRCFDVVKIDVGQKNVVSTMYNVVKFKVEMNNVVDLTLCDVATSYQPKNNVEPTLKCLLGDRSHLLISTLPYWDSINTTSFSITFHIWNCAPIVQCHLRPFFIF